MVELNVAPKPLTVKQKAKLDSMKLAKGASARQLVIW
jgi:hypothetical protein